MNTKKYLVIINPAAGRERQAFVESVILEMRRLGVTPDVYYTRAPLDATTHLQQLPDVYDVIVPAGGDGTINEVINGMSGKRASLGLIPSGTTNVLATELAYPSKAEEIAAVLVNGEEKDIFLSRVNGHRFSMMVGIGYDAWVVEGVNLDIKKKWGKLAYVLSMLQQLKYFGSKRYLVKLDDSVHSTSSMVITKGKHYGGSYILTREADMEKPSLQVMLIQTENRLQFLAMLFMLPLGLVEKLRFIKSIASRRIEISQHGHQGTESIQADGDTVSHMPAIVEVEAQATRVMVPR